MHETPCQILQDCKEDTSTRITNLEKDVGEIKDDVKAMREIIEAWNNSKGFVITLRIMSKVMIFVTTTGAALAGIYWAIKNW